MSDCEPYREVILAKLQLRLSAQRIFQDLGREHGFEGSYDSVKRFVRKVRRRHVLPVRRMACPAGEEVQVDFGTGEPVITPEGKRRRTHVFRMVLSHTFGCVAQLSADSALAEAVALRSLSDGETFCLDAPQDVSFDLRGDAA